MEKKITNNLIVKHLYAETSQAENQLVNQAMENDWEFQETYQAMAEAKAQLPAVTFSPSKKAVQNILHHNEETTLEPLF